MSTLSIDVQRQIEAEALQSPIFHYRWKGRGLAPIGYIEGLAVCFAHCLLEYRTGDAVAIEMAKAITSNARKDALAWYRGKFVVANLSPGLAMVGGGEDTLRHLFVLMLSLGMRESSGTYCDGRDMSARNTTAETAEAGMFQMSWDIRHGHPLIASLFDWFKADKDDGYLDSLWAGCGRV